MSRRHPKKKGGGGRFAMLPLTVLDRIAVTTLSHATFRVLVLMAGQFSGHNNGALGLSKRQAEANNVSNKTLYKALADLEERGLIEKTYTASRVPPRPTMYALTWIPMHDTEWSRATRIPAHSYKDWAPKKKAKLSVVINTER